MNKTYNILWIDDEYNDEALLPFILQGEQQGLILHGYGSFKEGFNALEANITFYDAILLDALFFEDETSETPNPVGLGLAIQKINQIKDTKVFPYFVLSGQTNFTDETNPILEAFQLKCFNKKNPEDVKELIAAIKKEADKQIDLQIKHENKLLFGALNKYPDSARDVFIDIFKGLKGFHNLFDDQLFFTQLRIILETLFRKANAIGLLHDKCVQVNGSNVNLYESYLFLSGLDTNYFKVNCSVTHFPKIIAENVRNIIHTTGAASHTSVADMTQNIHIQAYRKDINTSYLLYSLALQLMDVLIWFDNYSNLNTSVEINQSYWQDFETDEYGNKFEIAAISNISASNWGTVVLKEGKRISVFHGDVTKHSLAKGDLIKFTVHDSAKAQNITKQ